MAGDLVQAFEDALERALGGPPSQSSGSSGGSGSGGGGGGGSGGGVTPLSADQKRALLESYRETIAFLGYRRRSKATEKIIQIALKYRASGRWLANALRRYDPAYAHSADYQRRYDAIWSRWNAWNPGRAMPKSWAKEFIRGPLPADAATIDRHIQGWVKRQYKYITPEMASTPAGVADYLKRRSAYQQIAKETGYVWQPDYMRTLLKRDIDAETWQKNIILAQQGGKIVQDFLGQTFTPEQQKAVIFSGAGTVAEQERLLRAQRLQENWLKSRSTQFGTERLSSGRLVQPNI